MTREITIRQAGGSLTTTLPRDMANRLHLKPGDRLIAIETERGILLTPYDPDFAKAMEVYARGASKYRNALRELSR